MIQAQCSTRSEAPLQPQSGRATRAHFRATKQLGAGAVLGIDVLHKGVELHDQAWLYEAQGYLNHPKGAITLATRCTGVGPNSVCIYRRTRLTGCVPCAIGEARVPRTLSLFEHLNGTHWDGCNYGGWLATGHASLNTHVTDIARAFGASAKVMEVWLGDTTATRHTQERLYISHTHRSTRQDRSTSTRTRSCWCRTSPVNRDVRPPFVVEDAPHLHSNFIFITLVLWKVLFCIIGLKTWGAIQEAVAASRAAPLTSLIWATQILRGVPCVRGAEAEAPLSKEASVATYSQATTLISRDVRI